MIKKYWAPFLVIIIYFSLSNALFGYFCPSMALLGLPCPACGMTRAAFSLARLNFHQAFFYNPMIFPFAAACLINLPFFLRGKIKFLHAQIIILVVLAISVFWYRAAYHWGEGPLVINVNSLAHRLIKIITG